MSTRKATQDDAKTTSRVIPTAVRPRKKARAPRVRLTHFEIRRGETLRLRIAVADDALAEVGDELGALIKRIAPSTRTTIVEPVHEPDSVPDLLATRGEDFVVSRAHVEHDAAYHAQLREHLVELFSSFCDTALEDALDVARNERDRRAEGGN
jgi:hypothetical protein